MITDNKPHLGTPGRRFLLPSYNELIQGLRLISPVTEISGKNEEGIFRDPAEFSVGKGQTPNDINKTLRGGVNVTDRYDSDYRLSFSILH